MKIKLKKWGHSLAIRFPKAIIWKNNMQENDQLEIISTDEMIILEPCRKKVREGWEEAAMEAHKNGDDRMMMNLENDFNQEGWTW